jgi:acyl dehydratase
MTSTESIVARLKSQARPWARGNRFEDFEIGRRFVHHWGRTISESDSRLFTSLTLHYNPEYTNAIVAAAHGHPATPINPLLVFNTVFGLSVEDLSEGGGPFLGVNDLVFHRPVYPGDTLFSQSEVTAARLSDTRPGYGVVTWKTVGTNQGGETVVTFERSNLVRTRT